MKIVYLCEFSAGADGVWNRIYNIAKYLAKKYDVYVLSSNIIKGIEKEAKPFEIIDNIKIYRFPAYLRIGENTLFWKFERKVKELKPDIIHAHVFRHPHSTFAPQISNRINANCFLTTHAPFVEKRLRTKILNIAVTLYDKFLAKKILNSYRKVIAITKWEIPLLLRLGCKRSKISYIPNGFPKEFLKEKIKFSNKKIRTIIFLGRIAPIKNLELLLESFKNILDKGYKAKLKVVGPIEKGYELSFLRLIKKLKLNKKIELVGAIYDLKKKISILRNADIFVLPSRREASPISLLEAMASGLVVISSNTLGAREFLEEGKNGFIFNNADELTEKLIYCIENYSKLKSIKNEARKSVKSLNWDKISRIEEKLYLNLNA